MREQGKNGRVSDERLAEMLANYEYMGSESDTVAALTELQQRRASVVTPEMKDLARRLDVAADGFETVSFDRLSLRRGYKNLLREAAAALSVSHETGDGETQAALPITDETQGVKREPGRLLIEGYSRSEMHTDAEYWSTVLSPLEAVERQKDDLAKALLRWMREAEDQRTSRETAESSLAAMTAERDDAREALKPFADFADALNEEIPDNISIGIFAGGAMRFGPSGGATLASLRAARAALSEGAPS